jgi:hypothetical protein
MLWDRFLAGVEKAGIVVEKIVYGGVAPKGEIEEHPKARQEAFGLGVRVTVRTLVAILERPTGTAKTGLSGAFRPT